MKHPQHPPVWPLLLFFLSGTAGLGGQMVWVKMFAAGLGHEVPALLAITTAFLGGMALGAWVLGRRIGSGATAVRWYAGLELVIGGWILVTVGLIPAANRLALALAGPAPAPFQQWLVVFLVPMLVLLPATAAMGATLPAMERLLSGLRGEGRWIGLVYAANTFGAVAGTLGSVLFLMPTLGFRVSLLLLALLNLFCGFVALKLGRSVSDEVQSSPRAASRQRSQAAKSIDPRTLAPTNRVEGSADKNASASISFRRLGLTVFCTGLLGVGYQLATIRVLSQVLENTVYTYAAALTVYLTGTAAGAGVYQRFGVTRPFRGMLAVLLWGTATACLLGTGLLSLAPMAYDRARHLFGDSIAGAVAAELLVAGMTLLLPTAWMGAAFSHLVQAARPVPGGIGRAGALNTFGCALAAVLVGVWLLPSLGTQWTLVVLSLAYLVWLPGASGALTAGPIVLVALLFAALVNLRLIDLPPGAQVAAFREGVMASVAVVRTPDGHRSLRVNNRLQMGGTAAALAERRQAHLPLLLHPNPRRALFLGPGTGITLGAGAAYPGLQADGVELVPEVIQLMPHFQPENEDPSSRPNLRVLAADARRYVRTTTNHYDLIVADLFHPGQDGAGFLYTREHFQAVRDRLRPGGMFCQWLPLHQLDEPVLRSIIRTFLETFSHSQAFLLHFNVDIPALALIGGPDPMRLPPGWFERRAEDSAVRARLREAGLERPLNVLGCFVAGPEALRNFSRGAPVSTDNHPVVLFAAPRFTVRRDARSYELLLTVLERCRGGADDFVKSALPEADATLAGNLRDFIAARDIYLKGLVSEDAGKFAEAVDAYLDSARRSLFFTPAYARMITIIQALAGADRARARELFQRLEAAQPAQPLGRKMLAPLFEENPANR